jgi:peptidyl-tRNA hydrolase, PTH1 family
MWLVVGLGNPGPSYEHTRHNAGFIAVDTIIRRYNFSAPKSKFQSSLSEGVIEGEKILALKPLQYMNLSGIAVREAAGFYKIPLDHIIVLHDEIDLPFGKIKVKTGGGSGGHNGLKSLDAHIGKDYMRVRIGVGHPGDRSEVSNYVLGNFSKHEQQQLQQLTEIMSDSFPLLFKEGKDAFMNKLAILQQ